MKMNPKQHRKPIRKPIRNYITGMIVLLKRGCKTATEKKKCGLSWININISLVKITLTSLTNILDMSVMMAITPTKLCMKRPHPQPLWCNSQSMDWAETPGLVEPQNANWANQILSRKNTSLNRRSEWEMLQWELRQKKNKRKEPQRVKSVPWGSWQPKVRTRRS